MPGRFFLTRPLADLAAVAPGPMPNDPPRRNIQPGQEVLTLSPAGWGKMRWGMIPVGRVNARGRPVMETIINARSETVFDKSAYAGTGRAVVPLDGWYEWTGEGRKKQPWRLTPRGEGPFAFAAISDLWRGPGGVEVAQVAMVTCPPNREVAPVHHRMGVILPARDWPKWIGGAQSDAAALMLPLPDGEVLIEPNPDVDWTAA